MTKNIVLSVFFAGILTLQSLPCFGQQAHHPQITFGHKGIGQLKKDVGHLLKLTNPNDQKQKANIIDFIDLIAFGLDESRPLRVDFHSGNTPPTYLIWAPVKDYKDLIDNVESNFVIKKTMENLWELLPPDIGWYRTLPGIKYALLILTNPGDHALMKQLIQKVTDPMPDIKTLVDEGSDLGVILINRAQTKEDQQKRSKSFQEIRAVRMDALQKRPNESKTEFELRKGVVATQLDELERLMVEASEAAVRVAYDREESNATIEFESQGIADTSFAEAVNLFHKHDDAFANIPKANESVLSVRINHPIDDLRQKNSNRIIDLMTADGEAKIAATSLAESEKKAARELHRGIMKLASDSVATGNVNAFLETVLNKDGELVGWGAVSVKDGNRLNELLRLVPKSGKGNELQPGVATVNGVVIHKVAIADGYSTLLDKAFGTNSHAYIGVTNDYVWIGTGPGALEPLKAAIEAAGEPKPSEAILKMDGHLLPFAKRIHKLVSEMPAPTSADAKTLRRENLRRLAQGIEALQTEDEATFDMQVENGKFSGQIFINTGVLRFLGMQLAQFSRDTLQ